MKKFLPAFFLFCSFAAGAQVYNNEWIRHSQTYFKFKVGKTGLYRISQTVLAAAGLSGAPAEQFQLWRHGVQVPIYTSAGSGPLGAGDYIEFWGQMNDGKVDRQLYRNPDFQLNDKWSLSTDTATYFLTVNPVAGENLRLQTTVNNVAGNALPAEPYFLHTAGQYFKNRMNNGYAVNVGEYLYSSSYDRGEGYTSTEIAKNGSLPVTLGNLFVYTGGPAAKLKIAASGNVINARRFKVTINADSVWGNQLDFFGYTLDSVNFPLSLISTHTANISVTNQTTCTPSACPSSDRMVVHKIEITYPRQFNFGGSTGFEFTLPATAAGNYLEISNFNYGGIAPVLYDLTNGRRYVADLGATPLLRFALLPSPTARELVVVSEEAAQVTGVTSLQPKNFIDFSQPANQGDYLIITHPSLLNGPNGTNPVDDYRAYRSSATGGGYNAQIYLAEELIDQFGFGIKRHPVGIRNFIRFANEQFAVKPQSVFIIGKGVQYVHNRTYESGTATDQENLARLNLVPTFGWPASDVLLAAKPGSSKPELPIGRLSVISGTEVAEYLSKMKEFETAQSTSQISIADKSWMKNVVHIVGASDNQLSTILNNAMDGFRKIIADTLYGAKVTTFAKSSSDAVQQLSSDYLSSLFSQGISIITYFGHSSATTLEFNLDNPENYNNQGKYPLFIGLGCNAGNFFNYNPVRFITKETISERYVLSPNRGTIGFIASTHFGIVHYLDIWNTRAYRRMSSTSYGATLGEIMMRTAEDVFAAQSQDDYYARTNVEETALHGDPALRLNPHPRPDYAIEDPMVKVSPSFISVADASFKLDARFVNLGKAPDKDIVVEVRREFPDQTNSVILRDTIPGIRWTDSISLHIPIDPIQDKGLNRITVLVDADNAADETFETNNVITKDVMIYDDEARPVYPYNYAIINQPSIKLKASTANPFSEMKDYRMEMDTTELFNSPFKITRTVSSSGGIMEFDPGISFTDNTVYYWRVAPVLPSGQMAWNTASFIYLSASDLGYNQSHPYQHLKSTGLNVSLDPSSRLWSFGEGTQNIFVRVGSWITSTSQEAGLSVAINTQSTMRNTCWFQSLVFNVFDPVTFQPWVNSTIDNAAPVGHGLYGSASNNCFTGRVNNFEFRWDSVSNRKRATDFINNVVPDGAYVLVRSMLLDPVAIPSFAPMLKYAHEWQDDTLVWGSGQSLYHALKQHGFADLDSFNRPRQFAFVFRKGDPTFTPKWVFSQSTYDNVTLSADCPTQDTIGFITSPQFGPSRQWKEMKWSGSSLDASSGDYPLIDIIGIRNNGSSDVVMTGINMAQQQVNLSAIDPAVYPYLQLRMRNTDTTFFTPYQLDYWRITYDPAPEGGISPNIYFSMKDTVDVAEPLEFKMAFKNISAVPFPDSLSVKIAITDRNNVTHVLPVYKQRSLQPNDTLHVRFPVDTRRLTGANTMHVQVNPDFAQPEQHLFNNFFYRNFYVRGDTLNPLLDVTFDHRHILNRDIVSAKPDIMIKLKDEARWYRLADTSNVTVQVRFPDGTLKPYYFDNTVMQYLPASQAPGGDNTATVHLKPHFDQDGEYELIVSGKDMSENAAGALKYRVAFRVINTAMISNMLNYPNPFTTSTAFVFTITGSEVPQNIKIQIMTVTGKIVREITKAELGPIRVGKNITEFKWDGTDQYGQKLGNGVYLYRVVTNLDGKSLGKFTDNNENTDQYFNKGYGKMYLMR